MTNLLAETEQELRALHKSPTDVAWVGSRDGTVAGTWERFVALTYDLEYNAGYGSQEIAHDLVVVFADGSWLERHEYDGSEHWAYKTRPLLQLAFRRLERVDNDRGRGVTGVSLYGDDDD